MVIVVNQRVQLCLLVFWRCRRCQKYICCARFAIGGISGGAGGASIASAAISGGAGGASIGGIGGISGGQAAHP